METYLVQAVGAICLDTNRALNAPSDTRPTRASYGPAAEIKSRIGSAVNGIYPISGPRKIIGNLLDAGRGGLLGDCPFRDCGGNGGAAGAWPRLPAPATD